MFHFYADSERELFISIKTCRNPEKLKSYLYCFCEFFLSIKTEMGLRTVEFDNESIRVDLVKAIVTNSALDIDDLVYVIKNCIKTLIGFNVIKYPHPYRFNFYAEVLKAALSNSILSQPINKEIKEKFLSNLSKFPQFPNFFKDLRGYVFTVEKYCMGDYVIINDEKYGTVDLDYGAALNLYQLLDCS